MDIRSKQVAVFIDGLKRTDEHDAVLPGTLSSGVYLLRLAFGAEKPATLTVRQ